MSWRNTPLPLSMVGMVSLRITTQVWWRTDFVLPSTLVYIANVSGFSYISLNVMFTTPPIQMWNAFDFSFIVIFLVYFCLRIKGLHNNDCQFSYHVRNSLTSHLHTVATSRLAFDILACGSCILFPRWVSALRYTYILTSSWWRQIGILCGSQSCHHSVCLHNPTRSLHTSYLATNSSLQAMIVQFVMFIGTVIICFSGLMFTLWILGNAPSLESATLTKEPWIHSQRQIHWPQPRALDIGVPSVVLRTYLAR